MAKEKSEAKVIAMDGYTPVRVAYIYEPCMIPGANGLKTLDTKETPGMQLWRTPDATLMVSLRGVTSEIRNFKLLIYA